MSDAVMNARRERKLIRGLRERDEEAFTEVVRLYQHKVFNVCFRIVGDSAEAEDVAQEVFVAVFKYIDTFRGEAKFTTWLYRIAINRARNRLKYLTRRAQHAHQSMDEGWDRGQAPRQLGDEGGRPDGQALGRELEGIIHDGLQQLSEEHRTIVVLRDIENLSYEEIAEITELPPGTVKSRLFRARMALKEYVSARYNPPGGA